MARAGTVWKLIGSAILPGIMGGLLAFLASNAWFFNFAARWIPGVLERQLLPDFFSFLQIDLYVGAGCGYAGSLSGPQIADLFSAQDRHAQVISMLYTFGLGLSVSLIANTVLLLMSLL